MWAREIGESEWKKLPANLLAHAEQIVIETERADSLENAFRESVAFRAPSNDLSQTGRMAMARDYCTEVGIALYEATAAYRRALDAYRDTWIDIVLGLPDWDGSPGVPSPMDLYDLGAAAYQVASLKATMVIIAGWFSAGDCFR